MNQAASDSSVFGASPKIRILTPPAQTETQGSMTISGTCLSGINVAIGGDIASPTEVTCVNQEFEATIELANADGQKNVSATQIDSFSQMGGDNRVFVKDTTAPMIQISAPVANQPVRNSVSLSGTCESGKSVRFNLDTLTATANCTNGMFASTMMLNVADGEWDLSVTQTDSAGNSSVGTRHIIKDATPLLTVTSPLANTSVRSPVTISGACEFGFNVKLSGTGLASAMTTPCLAASNYSIAAALSANDGPKAIIIEQTDGVGVKTTANLSVVRTDDVPAITIAMPALNTAAKDGITVSGACQNGLIVNISGAGVATSSTTACANGTYSAAITFSAGDGNKLVTASQTNALNVTGTISRNFIRDSAEPAITISSPLANAETKSTVQLIGACETGIQVKIAGSGVTAQSTANCTAGQFSTLITLSANDGMKTVEASQTDSAANVGKAVRIFIRDNVAPAVAITMPIAMSAAETGLQISGTCESAYIVSVAGTGVQSPMTTACSNGNFSANILFSANDGNKVIEVSQTDGAGNKGTNLRTFVRQAAPPDGAVLYAQNCASCHNQLATSTKRDRTVLQIKNSIVDIPQMRFLSVLTPAQILAITAALSGSTEPTGPITAQVSDFGPVLGDRTYMASFFNDVFKAPAAPTAEDTTIKNVIQQHVKDKIAAMGGPCTVYDSDCVLADKSTSLMVTASPAPSPSRKGYTTRTCEEILQLDTGVSNALTNAGLTTASVPNDASVLQLATLFQPVRVPPANVVTALVNIGTAAQNAGYTNLDRWRYIMLPMCTWSLNDLL